MARKACAVRGSKAAQARGLLTVPSPLEAKVGMIVTAHVFLGELPLVLPFRLFAGRKHFLSQIGDVRKPALLSPPVLDGQEQRLMGKVGQVV
jgi:hypothetical protein